MADAAVEQTDQPKAKVFISYSRKDMEFADRLEAALKARGFEPLIDRTDIYAFEKWWERIEALIARADTVVFVLSPDAVASEVTLREVGFAASLNKRFAPVVWRRVDDKLIPEVLAKLNFIFFDHEPQFEQRANQLTEALRTDIGWIRQHTDFGEQARRWKQAKGASGLLLRSPVLEQAERWIASRPPGGPAPTEETQAFIRRSRQAATRRRNIWICAAAVGLVLTLMSYWAYSWQEAASANRNFQLAITSAQKNLNQVLELLNHGDISRKSAQFALEAANNIIGQVRAINLTPETTQLFARLAWTAWDINVEIGLFVAAYNNAKSVMDLIEPLYIAEPNNPSLLLLRYESLWRMGDAIADQDLHPHSGRGIKVLLSSREAGASPGGNGSRGCRSTAQVGFRAPEDR